MDSTTCSPLLRQETSEPQLLFCPWLISPRAVCDKAVSGQRYIQTQRIFLKSTRRYHMIKISTQTLLYTKLLVTLWQEFYYRLADREVVKYLVEKGCKYPLPFARGLPRSLKWACMYVCMTTMVLKPWEKFVIISFYILLCTCIDQLLYCTIHSTISRLRSKMEIFNFLEG
jgi:hypothetical protein